MGTNFMKLRVFSISSLFLLAVSAVARSEDGECQTYCPRCNVVCVPSHEIEKEKKTAFEVRCKWICVPKIRFPWEPCCKPKCAWVRKVKVLEKIEYECPKCKYKWTAVCKCPSCPSGRCPHLHGLPQQTPETDPPPPPVDMQGKQASFDEPSRPLLPPFLRFFRIDAGR
jgi:hypothetical protein